MWVGIAEIDYRHCNCRTVEGTEKSSVTVGVWLLRLDCKNTKPNKAGASAPHVLARRVLNCSHWASVGESLLGIDITKLLESSENALITLRYTLKMLMLNCKLFELSESE